MLVKMKMIICKFFAKKFLFWILEEINKLLRMNILIDWEELRDEKNKGEKTRKKNWIIGQQN